MKFQIELDTEEIRDLIKKAVKEEMQNKGLFRFIRTVVNTELNLLFIKRKDSITGQIKRVNSKLIGLQAKITALERKNEKEE